MTGRRTQHMTDLLFTLALFCVFAVCALLVVVMGADVYQKGVEDMGRNFDSRTSLSYIATKLRQSDLQGGISLGSLDGTPALTLTQTVEEVSYRTWIYCDQGSLKEVFTLADLPPKLSDGQAIMDLKELRLEELEDGLIRIIAVEPEGRTQELLYTPRSS